MSEATQERVERSQHVLLEIEVPAIYTDDLDGLREYQQDYESESDWLLNCIGEPSVCRITTEVHGEKDSDVINVLGSVRGARLVAPSRGYGDQPQLTDAQLQGEAEALEVPPEELISTAVNKLLADGCDFADLIDDLRWNLERVERRAGKEPVS